MAKSPKLSNNKKRKIQMLLADAFAALQQHEHQQCEQLCSAIHTIQPDNADANYILGVLARDGNQPEQSERYFKQAIATAPKRVDFITALAGLYLSIHAHEQAQTIYEQALALQPHDIHALTGLAGVMVCLERYDEAIALLERAKKQRPGSIDIRMGLFQATHDSGRTEQARMHLQEILKRDASHAQALYHLSLLEIETGDIAAGADAIRRAIECKPDYTEAYIVLADLQRFTQINDDLEAMQALYDRCPDDCIERMNMAFALAKAYDDIAKANPDESHFDTAFTFMQEANHLRHRFSTYDEKEALQQMHDLMTYCTAERLAGQCSGESAKQLTDPLSDQHAVTQAIFILGMPRSGTTLVEQILAAHPDVHGCGENAMFDQAMASISQSNITDPLQVCDWSEQQCQAVAADYLQRLHNLLPSAHIFTDKTLSHILHIGSIARLFPHAKIIHVRRNALDTCLSIYKNNITGSQFDYGHQLDQLGHYYRAYEQLMAHWRQVLPKNMLIEIDYEQLVSAPEKQSKSLIDACGLPWHADCLDFQHANNRVLTASMTQVRQPIYQRSVGTAQPYHKHLQMLIVALEG